AITPASGIQRNRPHKIPAVKRGRADRDRPIYPKGTRTLGLLLSRAPRLTLMVQVTSPIPTSYPPVLCPSRCLAGARDRERYPPVNKHESSRSSGGQARE